MNVRGLGEAKKRRSVFNFMRNKRAEVIFLQEAHVENMSQLSRWRTEWGGMISASFGASNARGILTLVHPNSNMEIIKLETDKEGRILIVKVKLDGKHYVLCNIYAPNNDNGEFMEELLRMLDKFPDNDGIIMGGDFNLVLNTKLDRNGSEVNHGRMLEMLNTYTEKANLCDIWRTRNPKARTYTWHSWSRTHKPICSRIDFFLISQHLVDRVDNCFIEPGHLSDHSVVSFDFKTDSFHRGPGVWKFNNRLLNEEKFYKNMQSIIRTAKENGKYLDPNEKWEYIKMEIGRYSKKVFKK